MRKPGIWMIAFTLMSSSCERKVTPAPVSEPAPSASGVGAPTAAAPHGASSPVQSSTARQADAPERLDLSFDSDPVGGPAPGVEAVIGDWLVSEREGARGLLVDGSRWRSGTPSVNLADQARRLYGDRYAEFLDGVKAFAFFPLAVARQDPPTGDVRMSVRFYPIAGQIDQAAGIAFGIQPDGSYSCVRANALEDNILWARVTRGRRIIIDTIRNTPTPTRTWHTLSVELRGNAMTVELDGVQRFRKTLDKVPHGRVGLWSKADSQVLFDSFVVESIR